MRAFTAAVVLVAAAGPAFAGEDAQAEVRRTWEVLRVEEEKYGAEESKLRALTQAGKGGGEEALAVRKTYGEARKSRDAAGDAFDAAFVRADWSVFDAKADRDLLERGLVGAVANAAESGDIALATSASETLFARLPDNKFGGERVPRLVLQAAVRGEPLDAALARGEALLARVKDEPTRGHMLLVLADLRAALGRREEAVKAYASLQDFLSGEEPWKQAQRRNVDLRAALVGKPAPEIDAKTWEGGEPRALSSMKGKVVVVDFWATWCGPCRQVMPGLDALGREHRERGLEVIGLTRHYPNGYLPEGGGKAAESVKGIAEGEPYLAHLREFRARLGISYPFAVGTAADFQNYRVSGIPTLAVVDRDGTVALVLVGSGNEALLEKAVGRLVSGGGGASAGGAGTKNP